MVIPPVWYLGSTRRRINNSQLEEISDREKEAIEDSELACKMIAYAAAGITGLATLIGLSYVAYSHKDVPVQSIRAVYAP